jgi:oligopeptide transport system ATP-binding protein
LIPPLLSVIDLSVTFAPRGSVFGKLGAESVVAVNRVSFDVNEGEVFGIVGESGSGKTALLRTLNNLYAPSNGEIKYRGRSITHMSRADLRTMRRDVQLVFQNPYTSLHPRMTVLQVLQEPFIIYNVGSREERLQRIREILPKVGLSTAYLSRYPGQLSGGQRQRVGLARSLVLNPKLLLLDEPVSALDVSIQAQVLNLLLDLKQELGLTYVVVSHDLNIIRYLADRVGVMLGGSIVEIGSSDEIYVNPQHSYTRLLLDAAPSIRKSLLEEPVLEDQEVVR